MVVLALGVVACPGNDVFWLHYLYQRGEHCTKEHKAGRSISCQLFAQDWPNLRCRRFNNVEVDSINTLQGTVL